MHKDVQYMYIIFSHPRRHLQTSNLIQCTCTNKHRTAISLSPAHLDVLSLEVWHLAGEHPRGVYGADDRLPLRHDAVAETDTKVVLTKAWSLVHHPRTTLSSHIGITGGGGGGGGGGGLIGVMRAEIIL